MNQEAYTYKSLLKKVYDVICANDFVYFCFYSDIYGLTDENDTFWNKYIDLTLAQKKYIINKVSSLGSYWYNKIFRCPFQWKKLNNNTKCLARSLILISSTIRYINNDKDKEYYKKLLFLTVKHNRKRISTNVYFKATDFNY